MNDLLIVTKFTMKDMFNRKSFIIATIIIIMMIVIGFNIPNIIKLFNNNDNEKILISDPNNLFENSLVLLNMEDNPYKLILLNDNIDTI